MIWDEVKELGPLYALGTLDKETAKAIEDYLQEAPPEQKSEIKDWCELVALLPLALPSASAPEHLRERLLTRISEEALTSSAVIGESRVLSGVDPIQTSGYDEMDELIAQSEISTTTLTEADMADYEDVHEAPVGSHLDTAAEIRELPDNVYTFKPPQRVESRPIPWMLLAATVLLALTTSYLIWQNDRLAKQRNELAVQLNGAKGEVAVLKDEIGKFGAPETKVIAMAGQTLPKAGAKIMYDTKLQQWVISIYGLPAPPTDKEYQLWYVTKKDKISAAVFATDNQGGTVLRLTLPRDAVGMAATAVTLEPKGGSPQPTGDILLLGKMEL